MLPGINEDIVRGARVYHLQTEDRGERNPEGTSVLFLEGAVLASERRSYMGVTADGDRVRLVKKLMIRQHRSVLRRILEGEFDDVQVARRDFGESETEAEPLILEAGTLPEMGAMAAASAPGEARIPATPPPFDPERLRAATAAIAGVPIAPAQAAPATVLLVDLPPGGAAAAASSDVTLDGFGATVDIPGDLVDAAARPAPPPLRTTTTRSGRPRASAPRS